MSSTPQILSYCGKFSHHYKVFWFKMRKLYISLNGNETTRVEQICKYIFLTIISIMIFKLMNLFVKQYFFYSECPPNVES